MLFTKLGHACARFEKDGQVLVVDPGSFTEPVAYDGADAILITHVHADHFDQAALRAAADASPALQIWTNGDVADALSDLGARVHRVGHGDTFTAAGFDIEAHGEWHAVIHPDIPRVGNVGFLVDGAVFHPGDALTVPDRPVGTLLLPVHAPWSKVGELIDYIRAVGAERAYAVHDAMLSPIGLTVVKSVLDRTVPDAAYQRLEPGTSFDLA
ncbi:MAG TPA: MBL fold metallo-hydrolase [Actinocrinis sp.]|nr:MBL fold metallo-hydrolase [Actinocrinis sp.]